MNENDVKQELNDLNIEMGKAEKNRDADYFQKVLHEDLRFRRANKKIVTKKEYLWDLIQPENTFEELSVSDVEVTTYGDSDGDTAVVSLLVYARFKRPNDEEKLVERKGTYRNTRVFVKTGNEWQCAFWFNTEIDNLPTK